ncbi:ATP-binding protein [Streptacidiphilus sp. N1-10]|uniref:ATP-binding protein n=1 Tax=Streptacidiphilus jeojiensis TaxID=3229225 RepID=A0ABV6XIA8_9ACTN
MTDRSRKDRTGHRTLCRWTRTTPHPTAYAREQLRPALRNLGLDDEAIDDTVLAASEIIANATEHAEGPYELRLRTSGDYLVLEVHDRSHHLQSLPETGSVPAPDPAPGPAERLNALVGELAERGRRLALVHTLVQGRLTVRRTPTGKCTTISVPTP